jgi:nitrate/TMAO reductase-like tetraheme cytochrome c subunit
VAKEKPVDDSSEPTVGGYFRNWLSLGGIALMVFSLSCGVLFGVLQFLSSQALPYVGILYVLCTGALVVGFLLVPLGALIERSRRRAGRPSQLLYEFRLDLRNRQQRITALLLLSGAVLVLMLVPVGAYRSFQATESRAFCGELCHKVMKPEWVRYQHSPHARVRCVDCHIGPGAGWFVRSKLSGLRQVWAVIVNDYPRPIPTPIRDLRPARETCEECHWRRAFAGYKEIARTYYLSGKDNFVQDLRMLLKVGGERTTLLRGFGIHYHMLIDLHVEYIATGEHRQDMAWLRVTRSDGTVTEYNNGENPLTDQQKATLEKRTMDCMDCHNRPSHQFPTATHRVDEALAAGSVSLALPSIKVQAVRALDGHYKTMEEAMAGIESTMRGYYEKNYPEVAEKNAHALASSIENLQSIYRDIIFPYMRSDWSVYPDNIGHLDSPGCFRCHNDEMVSDKGDKVATSCYTCHVILAQGKDINEFDVNLEEGEPFVHPEDFETIEEYTDCTDCHTGGESLYD